MQSSNPMANGYLFWSRTNTWRSTPRKSTPCLAHKNGRVAHLCPNPLPTVVSHSSQTPKLPWIRILNPRPQMWIPVRKVVRWVEDRGLLPGSEPIGFAPGWITAWWIVHGVWELSSQHSIRPQAVLYHPGFLPEPDLDLVESMEHSPGLGSWSRIRGCGIRSCCHVGDSVAFPAEVPQLLRVEGFSPGTVRQTCVRLKKNGKNLRMSRGRKNPKAESKRIKLLCTPWSMSST